MNPLPPASKFEIGKTEHENAHFVSAKGDMNVNPSGNVINNKSNIQNYSQNLYHKLNSVEKNKKQRDIQN
jgi:hypothetical protein